MTWRKRIIIGVSITFSGLLLSLTKNLFLEILGLIFVLTGFILVLQLKASLFRAGMNRKIYNFSRVNYF